MRDAVFKIQALWCAIHYCFQHWKKEVWAVNLDEQVCCSGRDAHSPCGCMGVTHRQEIEWNYFGRKPQ